MSSTYLAISIILLLLHFYFYCPLVFAHWELLPEVVFAVIRATGLFHDVYFSKFLVLVFLGLSLLGPSGRKDEKIRWEHCVILVLVGLFIYFISCFLPGGIFYILVNAAGFILMLTGGHRLARIIPASSRVGDPFGKEEAGFPQEQRKLETKFSINLASEYVFKGRKKHGWINIVNARRGVMVIGSPGSGKSWFIIEPCIRQLMEKGMAMFIYDFKYDALTRLAYNLFLQHRDQYSKGTAFYTINFSDISRSHRCNLLDIAGLQWISDAFGVSRTLLYSLNKTWIHKQGEFFVESPINFLAALIWFLRKYEDGRYCTLPHVIELAQVGYEELFSVLSLEPEVRTLISPFVEAYRDNIMDMLDSQVSSAKIPLARLASPDLYYILTGNDFNLAINDPAAPKIFCLGGDPPRQEALAPILSLYIDQLNKQVNRSGRHPCALICDEFATVRAYSMVTTIATARSNNIVPILAIQDINQLRTQYSREEADMMMDIAANVFCGQVNGETASKISQRFPKVLRDQKAISTNSKDTSFSHSQQWTETITPASVAGLSSGEFVGVVADDPDQPMEYKAFHAKLLRAPSQKTKDEPLPVLRNVSAADVLQVFQQVKTDIQVMISSEITRMLGDPDLKGLMVMR